MAPRSALEWERGWRHDSSALKTSTFALPDHVADLEQLACAAFIADRSKKRGKADPTPDHPLGEYVRTLPVTVHVTRSAFWRRPEVAAALDELLTWLTDDHWQVTVARDRRTVPRQAPLFDVVEPDAVALFSGGLDSVAGTAHALTAGAAGATVIGVSVRTAPRMRRYQVQAAAELSAASAGVFHRLQVDLHRIDPPEGEEQTRRTRGLVFLVAGFVAAAATRLDRLLVFENGVGAINLPYLESQRGSMTSRSVHPRTLHLAGQLFSLVLDRPFTVVNPCLPLTKAEMVARLPSSYAGACRVSESCDGAAAGRGAWRCGLCTSCLLRRQAFAAAGRSDWDHADGAGARRPSERSPSRLAEVHWQAHRLDTALRQPDPLLGLRRAYPELDAVLATGAITGPQLVRLYRTHVEEVRACPPGSAPDPQPEPGWGRLGA